MQPIRITEWISHPNREVETVQPVQINIYQNNIYKKDLGWLHLDTEATFERND